METKRMSAFVDASALSGHRTVAGQLKSNHPSPISGLIKLKANEPNSGRTAAFKPQQAPNFAQAAKPRVLNEPTEPLSPNFAPLFGGWINFEFHRKAPSPQ